MEMIGRMRQFVSTWWRHKMETFSALLVICAGIHRWLVNSPHSGQWCRALMFSLVFAWVNGRVNNREAGDLGRHLAHHDVTVMMFGISIYSTIHLTNVLQNLNCWYAWCGLIFPNVHLHTIFLLVARNTMHYKLSYPQWPLVYITTAYVKGKRMGFIHKHH